MTWHTPGPWHTRMDNIMAGDLLVAVAEQGGPKKGARPTLANAARIVQCVNALERIEDPAAVLAEVRAALTDARDRLAGMTGVPDPLPRVRAALALLTPKETA